jgi:hypothetical protein
MVKTHNLTLSALAAMTVVLSLAVVPALITTTYAAPPGLREGCENKGGNEPSGQQGKCKAGVWMSLSRAVEETDQADIIR